MTATYLYKPGVRVRLWDKVYSFDEDGRLITGDETLQAALEMSQPYLTGEITKEGAPLIGAVKLNSTLVDGCFWVVQDRVDWPGLGGDDEPVYDAREIGELEGMDLTPEELKFVHDTKKVFNGSIESEQEN